MRPKCSLTVLKVPPSSSRVSPSILLDRVFQRGHGLGQVGRLRIEEGLALARRPARPARPG
jgi:hypothetical protein